MKQFLYGLLLLTSLAIPQISTASIWSWIDTLETCSSSFPYCYNYQFTIGGWDENDSTPNPCYGQSACTIFIGHRHDSAGTSGQSVVRGWGVAAYPFVGNTETLGELGAELKKIFPLPYSGITNHAANTVATEECVGIFYAPSVNIGTDSATNNEKYAGYSLLPGSICGTAPQPSGTCDFDQDVLTLDHGTLSKRELEGHEVTENVSINCTNAETLKLYIFSADNVQLRDDGSLYSELYMNDTIIGTTGFTIDVTERTQVSVKSVLRTNGNVTAGEFSGSTVMLITVE